MGGPLAGSFLHQFEDVAPDFRFGQAEGLRGKANVGLDALVRRLPFERGAETEKLHTSDFVHGFHVATLPERLALGDCLLVARSVGGVHSSRDQSRADPGEPVLPGARAVIEVIDVEASGDGRERLRQLGTKEKKVVRLVVVVLRGDLEGVVVQTRAILDEGSRAGTGQRTDGRRVARA